MRMTQFYMRRYGMHSAVKRRASLSLVVCVAMTCWGCGDDGGETPTVDAMPMADASTDAMPMSDAMSNVCTAALDGTAELATEVSIMGDTSMVADTMTDIDLGDCYPEDAPEELPPQQVVALQVPGEGRVGVEFNLINDGTATNFSTTVQVREDCDVIPEETTGTCFGRSSLSEPRSRGAFFAEGGDTVYLVITGNPEPRTGQVSEGAWQLNVFSDVASTPVISEARVNIIQTFLDIAVVGGDAGRDARNVRIVSYDADGEIIDINFDGMGDDRDRLLFALNGVDGEVVFSSGRRQEAFGSFFARRDAVEVDVSIVDRFGDESPRLRVALNQPVLRGVGQSCDGASEFCPIDLNCEDGSCAVPTAVADACDGAVAVAVDTPTDTTSSTTVTTTLEPGTGVFSAKCTETGAAEKLFSVEVPGGGDFDLLATTALPQTGEIDTVLYVRTTCEDPTTEVECNDDSGSVQSTIEIRNASAGTYTLVVENYAFSSDPLPAEIGLEVSLRPVLASGAACDDAELENRCADGPCNSSVCP